jgi:hypothetical protein
MTDQRLHDIAQNHSLEIELWYEDGAWHAALRGRDFNDGLRYATADSSAALTVITLGIANLVDEIIPLQ